MKAPTPLFLIFALFIVSFSPNSHAQTLAEPSPPESLTVEIYEVLKWNPFGNEFQSFFNLTFTKSAEDDGTLKYNFYMLGGVGCDIEPCLISADIFSAYGSNIGSIPGYDDWFWLRSDVAGAADAPSNLTLYLTANNTAEGEESVFSCGVEVDFRVNLSFAQCGEEIEAPRGVGLLATASPTAETFGLVDMRWYLSEDDPNATNGTFQYWPSIGPKPSLMSNYTGATPTVRQNGMQNFTFDVGGNGGKFPFYGKVMARDPATHRRSDYSCVVYIDAAQQYSSSGCGEFSTSLAEIAAGDPEAPFINLTQTASDLGMTVETAAYIFGAAVILGIAVMCFVFGGFIIGILGTILGIVLIAAFGILPTWLLITLFLIAVSIVVIKLSPGGNPQ